MSKISNKFLAQTPANTIKGNNTGSTANVTDLTVTQAQTLLNIIPIPNYANEFHVYTAYAGGSSDGSLSRPYTTVQAAINAALAHGGVNSIIIMHDSSTENLVINNYTFNLQIFAEQGAVVDSQRITLNGNVTISGTSTRIRFKDINIAYPGGSQPDLIDTSAGRNYFSNVGFQGGGGIQFSGSWARWHEFTDCTVSGPISIAGTPSAGSTVSFWRVRGGGNYTLNASNATLQLYDSFSVGNVTQTAGVLLMDGGRNFVAGSTITSTTNSGSDLLQITNLDLETGANTWVQINKTGTCAYVLSNILGNEASDTLTGTRLNQGASARDFKYLPTTSGNWSSVPTSVLTSLDTLATSGVVKSQSANQVLASPNGSSGVPSFRSLVSADIPSLSGTYLPLAGGTMSGVINMGTNKITAVVDPTSAQDAATKNYVDSVASGLNPKQAAYAATIGSNIVGTYSNGVGGVGATFTVTATGAFTLDGTTPPVLSRILIKDQTSGFQNGVYDLTVAGTIGVSPVLTRSLDYNTPANMNSGDLIPVINGTVNAGTTWLQTATITTVGTDALVFTQWSASAANYLLKANNLSDVSNAVTAFNNLSPVWTTYTPTITGYGTVSSAKGSYKQMGDTLRLKIYFQAGTVAASLASFSLPGGFTLSNSSSKLSVVNTTSQSGQVVGTYMANTIDTNLYNSWSGSVLTAPSTSTSLVYVGPTISSVGSPLIPANGNVTCESTSIFSFECEVILA